MIADSTSGNVIAFPRLATRARPAFPERTAGARSNGSVPPRARLIRRVSSLSDLTLRWVAESIVVGLALAAAAHGPVSPDMFRAAEEMDVSRRHASGAATDA